MGFSIGFGVGPVRYSKPIGGRKRSRKPSQASPEDTARFAGFIATVIALPVLIVASLAVLLFGLGVTAYRWNLGPLKQSGRSAGRVFSTFFRVLNKYNRPRSERYSS